MIQIIASILSTTFVRESGRPDSNRRSQAPRACGLARLSHALIVPASSPCGNRTHLSALKGRYPRPIDERAIEWAGGRSNPRLPGFNRPLDRLSYRPVPWFQQKRPGVFVTPGLRLHARGVRGRASRPQGIERARTRRLFGGSLRSVTTQDVTRTTGEHGRPRCKRCLGPNRLGAGLGAWPVVLYSFRRRTPRGCSRDSGGLLSTGSFGGDPRRVERRSGMPARRRGTRSRGAWRRCRRRTESPKTRR